MISKKDSNAARIKRHYRVRKNISGTPARPRLNVYRSLSNIYAQVIDDTKGVTLCSASSKDLKLENGGNVEAAKQVGAAIAEKCKALNIESVRFDRGGYVYHGRVLELAEGAREGGLEF